MHSWIDRIKGDNNPTNYMNLISAIKWLFIAGLTMAAVACTMNSQLQSTVTISLKHSPQYRDGKFYNSKPRKQYGITRFVEIIGFWLTADKIDQVPEKPIPINVLSLEQLQTLSNDELYLVRLGHSSILLKVYGEYWLIDPVFAQRASPFSFVGPKRFHPPPISIEELPPITRILISHNHYDHLDKTAIKALNVKTKQFLVPLGVEGDLEKWGVEARKIRSFDWWQELQVDNALLAFTPSHHLSGRGLNDRNSTLWGSWVVKTPEHSLYFSGDSGYFKGFKTIGEKYGPFDLTFLENGAYNANWPDAHMFPEESVQAHIDLKGKVMMPIHNGTFPLSFHPWYEPFDRVSAEAKKRNVRLTTPIVGEIFTIAQEPAIDRWWDRIKSKVVDPV